MLETVKAYSKKNLRKTFSHRFVEYMMDMQYLSIRYEFEYIRRHNKLDVLNLDRYINSNLKAVMKS